MYVFMYVRTLAGDVFVVFREPFHGPRDPFMDPGILYEGSS